MEPNKPETMIRNPNGPGFVPLGSLDNVMVYGEGRVMTTGGIIGDSEKPSGLLVLVETKKSKDIPAFAKMLEEIVGDGYALNDNNGDAIHNADLVLEFRSVKGLDVLLFQLLQVRALMVASGHDDQPWPRKDDENGISNDPN